jgi:uncharacterized membrane protein YkoI
MPIAQILPLVSRYFAGDVIEVKLDTKRENVYYEIKVLDSAGRVRQLVLDARNGDLVKAGD